MLNWMWGAVELWLAFVVVWACFPPRGFMSCVTTTCKLPIALSLLPGSGLPPSTFRCSSFWLMSLRSCDIGSKAVKIPWEFWEVALVVDGGPTTLYFGASYGAA